MSDRVRISVAAAIAVALASLTITPVFETQRWLLPAWAAVALVTATGIALRATAVPRALVPVGQLVVLIEAVLLVVARDVMAWGVLPTAEAFRVAGGRVGEGLLDISRYAAPVPAERGLVLVAVLGIALVAVVTDLLAVTLRQVPWAGLPLLATYAVPAAVVEGGIAWYFFAALAAGYVGMLVAEGQHRITGWGRPVVGGRVRSGATRSSLQLSALSATGRRVGAAVIGLAIVVPAVLPGLPDAVFGTGGSGGGDDGSGSGRTIRTDNPIVDLRRDLIRTDNVEVLRYRSEDAERDYIRLVALDVFDGRVWQTSKRSIPRSQQVSEGMPTTPGLSSDVETDVVRTEWEVSDALASEWLPLTYPTTAVDIDGDWRYAVDTLDVVATERDTRGVDYVTTSLVVKPTADQLESAGAVPPDLQPLTELSGRAADLAEQALEQALTGRERDDYERAVSIQEWFRDNFEYSTARRAGNSESALADFLADRSGYCEQYAATMAIMARQLDIPARVGVGFLPGTRDADGEWVVRANDAHAWPELYFDGVGWTRFEPTPSDRVATPPSYTSDVVAAPTSGASTDATSSGGAPTGQGPNDRGALDATSGSGGAAADADQPLPWGRITIAAFVVLAVAAAPVAAMVARRRRWRGAEGDPVATAEAGWADLRDAVRDASLHWDPALSPRAQAVALGHQVRLPSAARDAIGRLARSVEMARYARRAEEGSELRADARDVRTALLADRSPQVRWRARLWPAAAADAFEALGSTVGAGLDALDLLGHRLRQRVSPRTRRSTA